MSGILLVKPNNCNKYITPVFVMSNVIVFWFVLEVDTEEVVVVIDGVVGVIIGNAVVDVNVDDVVLAVFVFCDV